MNQIKSILLAIVAFLSVFNIEKAEAQQFSPNFGAMRTALNTANNNYEDGFENLKSFIHSKNDIILINRYNLQKRKEQNKKLEMEYNNWGTLDLAIPSNLSYAKNYIDKIFYSPYIELECEILALIGAELNYRKCAKSSDTRCEELIECMQYLENCELSELGNIKYKFKLSNVYLKLNSMK